MSYRAKKFGEFVTKYIETEPFRCAVPGQPGQPRSSAMIRPFQKFLQGTLDKLPSPRGVRGLFALTAADARLANRTMQAL